MFTGVGKEGCWTGWFRTGILGLLIALQLLSAVPSGAPSAATQQIVKTDGEIAVFNTPDESSLRIESVKKGTVLSPIAESTGAGGVKWYMVKTARGSVGWIKADNSVGAKSVKKYFESLPREAIVIGPGVLPPAATGSATPGAVGVPVQSAGSALLVPVTINHSLDVYLLLDTGATITMVSSGIARNLALQTIGAGTALTVGGPVSQSIARLESLKVGEAEVRNLLVAVHDFHPDPRIGGLLGLDFLGRFHVSLDAKKRLLVLNPR